MSDPGALPRPPRPPLLDQVLRTAARRYRLPAEPEAGPQAGPTAAMALALEQVRRARAGAQRPDAATRQSFLEALAHLIREAMRMEDGDAAYQATVLARQAPQVQECIDLQNHAEQDRRQLRAGANAVAHPARRQHCGPGALHDALERLHAQAESGQWAALGDTLQQLLAMAQTADAPALQRSLARLLEGPALARLQRAGALQDDPQVQAYQRLRDRQGPRPGTAEASAYGDMAQQRGAAMETLAARALEALAQRLDRAEGSHGAWRVVTSLRVPPSIPASAERAKSEWDAVLLHQAPGTAGQPPAWDVCLLLEAKASVDAVASDFSRLRRGLRLLGHADAGTAYTFLSREGEVRLRGASLGALDRPDTDLRATVLYCTDAPAPPTPHLLAAASRMQLLGAAQSLAFATALAEGRPADAQDLEPVWQALLESPQWEPVLQQYPTLRCVRELMVHVDDLAQAVQG
ncbi:hypothetical protein PMI14_00060 [Acidovorax sp. CF316]|uniref:hypothetical protein n=1 Tax=Acidovorax sp. CF316 TaxID=1144317 RepID=UPI00026BD690|nr:hypothetical protein [Acidovorax sp. CF316]EJE55060.1 hypothetical protein PMI14_00060 [Acidovorax sp. CF316]